MRLRMTEQDSYATQDLVSFIFTSTIQLIADLAICYEDPAHQSWPTARFLHPWRHVDLRITCTYIRGLATCSSTSLIVTHSSLNWTTAKPEDKSPLFKSIPESWRHHVRLKNNNRPGNTLSDASISKPQTARHLSPRERERGHIQYLSPASLSDLCLPYPCP